MRGAARLHRQRLPPRIDQHQRPACLRQPELWAANRRLQYQRQHELPYRRKVAEGACSMTPSTTLTLEGFLRGLQAEIAALIGAVILILIVLLLARWLINQRAANRDVFDATSARSLANKI